MLKETKQYVLDMFELNELIAEEIILDDVLEEGRLDAKAFGRKLQKFQEDFSKFVNAEYKTKQDFEKVRNEQFDSLREIKSYKDTYHELYKDGKNNDADKIDDDLLIARLIKYEIVLKQHIVKLKEIEKIFEF